VTAIADRERAQEAAVQLPRALEVAQGLRELADWLDARPDLPVTYVIGSIDYIYNIDEGARGRFLELAAEFDEPKPERSMRDYRLKREFAGGVEIMLACEEQVLAPERPAPAPWPEEVRALAPDANWGVS
jgi:hypothetical protein